MSYDYGDGYKYPAFFTLKGKTIVDIAPNQMDFTTSDGKKYTFYHYQECCEDVGLHAIKGNLNDLLNSPITLAEEDNCKPEGVNMTWSDYGSHTWSIFILETAKGRVEFQFLGVSNGYYGETMQFVEYAN